MGKVGEQIKQTPGGDIMINLGAEGHRTFERRKTSNPGSSISVSYSLNSLLESGKYRKQTEFFMPELLACTKRDTMSSLK